MCGEHCGPLSGGVRTRGSSPHVRGTLLPTLALSLALGIIPACAGNTSWRSTTVAHWRDHPRMCGEHRMDCLGHCVSLGSSPHVRGTLGALLTEFVEQGIIPACAGNTRRSTATNRGARDHPRMCGEHPSRFGRDAFGPGSSPHVRGTPEIHAPKPVCSGIIPACAGNTLRK